MDQIVERNLLESKLFLNHPGQGGIASDIYSSPHNAELDLLKRKVYTGRYKLSSNSLTIPSTSTFTLSPGTVLSQVWVVCSIVFPQHARAPDGWFLKAIDRLELSLSGNSSIQSLQISGESHFQQVMATCASQEKRNSILQASPAFNLTGGGATLNGAMPLNLFFSSPEMQGTFALDSSTLQSQIQISIRWKPAYQWLSGSTGNAITVPTAFADLYMRCNQVEFSQGHPMLELQSKNPDAIYTIPSLYFQSFDTTATLTHGSETSISLSTIPAGNLQAILLTATPSTEVGIASTLQYVNNHSIEFANLRLLFNGQEIYRVEDELEEKLVSCLKADDDSGFDYKYLNTVSVAAAATNGYYTSRVHVIPFSNEISQVLHERRHEHTTSFQGSTLDLYFTPSATRSYETDVITRTTQASPTAVTYNVTVTYVIASLVEIDKRTTSLEL